jgi:hypothetical protein
LSGLRSSIADCLQHEREIKDTWEFSHNGMMLELEDITFIPEGGEVIVEVFIDFIMNEGM